MGYPILRGRKMLEKLKNKKALVGIIGTIALLGIAIGIICLIGSSNKNGLDEKEEIIEVLPDDAEGLELKEDDSKEESSQSNIDAPNSWDGREDSESNNSNNTTQDEEVGKPEESGNLSNDEAVDSKDEYGTVL